MLIGLAALRELGSHVDAPPILVAGDGTKPIASTEIAILRKSSMDTETPRSVITVGRVEPCDLLLRNPLVSKRHAYFRKTELGWFLVDAASANGTFVDDERLVPHLPRPLEDGCRIRFGLLLSFQFQLPRTYLVLATRSSGAEARR